MIPQNIKPSTCCRCCFFASPFGRIRQVEAEITGKVSGPKQRLRLTAAQSQGAWRPDRVPQPGRFSSYTVQNGSDVDLHCVALLSNHRIVPLAEIHKQETPSTGNRACAVPSNLIVLL